MTRPTVTHWMRAPLFGGSELETLTIVKAIRNFRHRILFPERFAGWEPSIRERFAPEGEVRAVPDVEAHLELAPPELLHIQFPFILVPSVQGYDSVLELLRVPRVPTIFTVHAAVNIPVVPDIHYVFHTASLYARFADRIPRQRCTICPSVVVPPPPERIASATRGAGRSVRILWVSRNEDAKFHAQVPAICDAVRSACPEATFRFVGRPLEAAWPEREGISVIDCPVPDLEAEYAAADVFWYFPTRTLEETWCRTVTEAMGWCLPSVVAAHGAMSEQVLDGAHGLVVDEPDACADALIALVRDRPRRLALGRAARVRAAGFYRRAIATLQGLYSRFLRA